MESASLRPLSLGEILDVAIKVYRRNFVTMAKVVAAFVVPVYLFAALVQLSAAPDDDDLGNGDFWSFVAALVVTGIAVYLASQLATAASFRVVSSAYLGEETDWRESLRFAVARFLPLVWVGLLVAFGVGLVLGGSIALAVLAFPLLAVLALAGIYLYGVWAVAVPALLFEDVRGTRALGRSQALVSGRWWPVFGTIVLATVLASIVGNLIGGLLGGLIATGGSDLAESAGDAVGNIVSGVITTPFVAAVTTVLYYDLRIRKEGFDIELLARRWDG